MHRFEHRVVLADVRPGNDAEAPDETRTEVAQHVAVQVLEQENVELCRVLHEAHATRVDDDLVVVDVGEALPLVHLARASNEHAVGHLHDVGLVHDGHLLATAVARIAKRPSRDS